ncbi:phenol hydroxylase [Legionella birminghamensis]|uniref:Phenol hydroxylase n=1 Tax=Legionella birminghamensis TaxID=28083 RepID=A0A378IBX6_9GAMM|nr:FAD-binding oxidoreductase [Legionella birminghamensis]KTC75491.1 phenol hydroxylase [Legionella birminghamensis]STX32717.1 phenol hydroxylase [Legionella birminghamensis]
MQAKTISARLTDAFMLSSKVKHFIFELQHNPPFNYLPGQFITIHFEKDGKQLKRSYSIANVPAQDNRIEFAAGYVENGPGTALLFNLQPDDVIQISGPFGRLILKDELPQRYVLVATSTGVTPYRAMLPVLRQRLQQNPNLKIVIMLGAQTPEDVLYEKEFLALAKDFPRQVIFRAQLSRAHNESLLSHQFRGYVQHAFSELSLNPQEDIVYLCGNPGMIDESFELLKSTGFATQQVIREKYISR